MNQQTIPTTYADPDRVRSLLRFGPVVSYCVLATCHYPLTFISENIWSQWGYTVDDCLQSPQFWLNVVHPDDLPGLQQLLQALSPDIPQCCEYRVRHQNGSYRWVQNHMQLVSAQEGQGGATIVGCWQDITERKHFEMTRALQEQLLQGIIESNYQVLTHANFHAGLAKSLAIIGEVTAADRVYICDSRGVAEPVESPITVQYAWTRSELKTPISQLPWSHQYLGPIQAMRWYQTLLLNLPLCGFVQDLPQADQVFFGCAQIRSVLLLPIFFDRQLWGFIGIDHCHSPQQWLPQDVSLLLTWAAMIGGSLQRHHCEAQLLHHAFHDPLTGLPNRSLLLNRLEQALAQIQRYPDYLFAVLFLDLDHFKAINDSLGHNLGDRLLVAIAKRLSNCLRPGDTIARLGGDEFVVLLHDIQTVTDATTAAQRIREQVSQSFQLGAHEIFADVSIGITLSCRGYESAEDILEDADQAMYQAKMAGKGQHQLLATPPTQPRWTHPNDSEASSEVVLYYQPIFSLISGQIAGFQVLPYWGASPSPRQKTTEFWQRLQRAIPASLSQPTLKQACLQVVQWQAEHPQASGLLSVHIDARQLLQPTFLEEIVQIVTATRLSPQGLRLELSNTAILTGQNPGQLFAAIRAQHIQICLRAFGNHGAALRDLYQFPIDAVKLDRSIIGDICNATQGHALVRSLVLLAQDLKLDVLAEGITTLAQLQYLQALQCVYGQGLLLYPPQTPTEIATLLAQNYTLP